MKIQQKHKLLQAVGAVTDITLTALTWQEDQELAELATLVGQSEPDAQKFSWLRIEKVSGLSAEQVDELATPDINTIKNFVVSTITYTADKLAQEFELDYPSSDDPMLKNLLQPLVDDTTKYKLRYPNGKLTKLLEQELDDGRRTFLLCEYCTGLTELQLKSMSTPDWNTLQAVLDNFLGKSAAFFRQ